MPTYQAECLACGNQFEYASSIHRCLDVPHCPLCQKTARKVILSAPLGFVTGKFDAFVSPVDGSVIRNQRELQNHNERNGVVNIQDGYSEDKVLKGDFSVKEEKLDPNERKRDIAEAIHDLEHGYKPAPLEVLEDE